MEAMGALKLYNNQGKEENSALALEVQEQINLKTIGTILAGCSSETSPSDQALGEF